MLIEYPHDFAGIHCGTAAEGNDAIRLKRTHGSRAGFCTGKCGIGSYIVETGMNDSHGIQFVFDLFGISVLVKESIGHNESSLLVHNCAKLIQSNRGTSFLKVYFLRSTEPKHIFSPFSYGLDVEQMFDTHIFGYGVAAPGTTAKGERRLQFEVVQITDTALG